MSEAKITLSTYSKLTKKEFSKASDAEKAFVLNDTFNYFLQLLGWSNCSECLTPDMKLKLFELCKLNSRQLDDFSLEDILSHKGNVLTYARLVNNRVEYVKEKNKK